MTTDTIAAKSFIAVAEPQLIVADIHAACAFFVSRLGFSIIFAMASRLIMRK